MHASLKLTTLLLAASLLALAQPAGARQSVDSRPADRGRVAPPAILACDRNQLTSYNGQPAHYQRDESATFITVATDWGTHESIEITHPAPDSIQNYFLLNGEAFPASGWQKIEAEPGVLLPGLRVIAWVCADGTTQPVVDWRPD